VIDSVVLAFIEDYEAARKGEDRVAYNRAHRWLAEALKARSGAVAINGWRYSVDVHGDVWRTRAEWTLWRVPRHSAKTVKRRRPAS
jgi:hypothetical protein